MILLDFSSSLCSVLSNVEIYSHIKEIYNIYLYDDDDVKKNSAISSDYTIIIINRIEIKKTNLFGYNVNDDDDICAFFLAYKREHRQK